MRIIGLWNADGPWFLPLSIRNPHVAVLATGTAVLLDLGSREAKGDVLEKSAGSTAVLVVSEGHKEALA